MAGRVAVVSRGCRGQTRAYPSDQRPCKNSVKLCTWIVAASQEDRPERGGVSQRSGLSWRSSICATSNVVMSEYEDFLCVILLSRQVPDFFTGGRFMARSFDDENADG